MSDGIRVWSGGPSGGQFPWRPAPHPVSVGICIARLRLKQTTGEHETYHYKQESMLTNMFQRHYIVTSPGFMVSKGLCHIDQQAGPASVLTRN